MIPRFIVYPLSHTILVVEITDIGLPTDIYPPDGELKMVPTLRFQSWSQAKDFLVKKGAQTDVIEKIDASVAQGAPSVLTIV